MNPKIIFLADDDSDDLELLEEAFMGLESTVIINKVSSGKEALAYLNNCSVEKLPCLIILDYNMHDLTGVEVLKKLYQNPEFKTIPVIIWSTSNAPIYKELSMKEGAIKYFEKPDNFEGIKKLALKMFHFCNLNDN
ncbi:MAG: response regulator [Chitinophagaceae bacterium]|nr:response regulator [Chitinophagaceae bacterium]